MPDVIDQDFSWHPGFRSNEIHIVCVASGGLTTCDLAASTIGGLDKHEQVWPMTRRVNEMGEVDTFHPLLPLTIVPLLSWGERKCPEDVEGYLRRCFQDVAEINRSHIRLKTMVIDLNGWGSDYPYDIARRMAEEVFLKEELLEKVIFLPEARSANGDERGHWMRF